MRQTYRKHYRRRHGAKSQACTLCEFRTACVKQMALHLSEHHMGGDMREAPPPLEAREEWNEGMRMLRAESTVAGEECGEEQ
jgi:hypothetical protein